MGTYSFLSGSSIDNVSRSSLDMFISGDCYLGFSRGTGDNQWGTLALINVEAEVYAGIETGYITTNNASAIFATASSSAVSGIFNDTKPLTTYVNNTSPASANNAWIVSADLDEQIEIRIIEGNESWLLVEGLPQDYYTLLNTTLASNIYIYRNHLVTSVGSTTPRFRILKKSKDFIPTYSVDCSLYAVDSLFNETLIANNLQRTITILGETQVTGLNNFAHATSGDSEYNLLSKTYLQTHSFKLVDNSSKVIVDNMKWVDTNSNLTYTVLNSLNNSSEMFLTMAVSATAGYTQHIKIAVGPNQIDEYAIWNEYLPFDSVIINSDSNPPGLEISYLRTPLIERSIFDVNGLYNIPTSAVKFVKELLTTEEYNTYNEMQSHGISRTSITLEGNPTNHYGTVSTSAVSGNKIYFSAHNFVVGDIIEIPIDPIYNIDGLTTEYNVIAVDYSNNSITLNQNLNLSNILPIGITLTSETSSINAIINYAYTTDIVTALRYGLTSIMIELSIPSSGDGIYDGLYRQLFVSYQPKDNNGAICTNQTYNQSIYNTSKHHTDIGTLLYLSNKIPVYRKYINIDSENFTLII